MKLLIKKGQWEEIILNTLWKKKKLTTHAVAGILNVSECTVRRFFDELEKKNEVVRIYGGIKLPPDRIGEYFFETLQSTQSEQKRKIGEFGCQLVENGEIIFLDSGTTIQQMAISLAIRIKKKELRDIQVFTNSLQNLTILSEYCVVNLIGGLFRNKRKDFCGHLSEMMLESVSFEKCFLSADGISTNSEGSIMATDIFTAKINQIVSQRTEKFYLLADSTKFSRNSFIRYAMVKDVLMIVTDSGLTKTEEEALSALGPVVKKV